MKSRSARQALHVTPESVSGRFRSDKAISQVVVLVDGVPQGMAATVPVGDGAFQFDLVLPAHVLGTWLDVLAIETGRSVLEAEFDLAATRGLRWGEWALRGRRVSGHFSFAGPAAPGGRLALPVEIRCGDEVYGNGFAAPEPTSGRAASYRFDFALNRLPPGGEPIELTPRVGGIAVRAQLWADPAGFGYDGEVEPSEADQVTGWAVNLANPRRRVPVELRIGGRTVASTIAAEPRDGAVAFGPSTALSGFTLPLPPGLKRNRDLQVAVVVAGTELNLRNSPFVLPAGPPYQGFFDHVSGPYASGWVVNMHHPEQRVRVEAICDGKVIGSATADLYRGDVLEAGMPSAHCGFRFLLEPSMNELLGRNISVRIAGTSYVVPGSPQQVLQNRNVSRFLGRTAAIARPTLARLARRMTHTTREIGISLIMPVYETPRAWLIEALASVQAQWSGNWELICIDDGSREPHVREILDAFAAGDRRIRVLRAPENMGIARAINFGLRAARGNYVAFLDHDDTIEPDAVYRLAEAAQRTGADLIYSDEVLTGPDINSVIQVRARPAFSHDFYLSHPYFVHMVCVRTTIARSLSGWNESLPISADVDFVLRVIEQAQIVAHVPRVLYRWRTHASSTGHAKQADVGAATKAALRRHLARLGHQAEVAEGSGYNEYRIDWPDDGGEVLVVIPTKDRVDLLRTCIESIERTSPDENYRIVVIDHQSSDAKTVRYLAGLGGRISVMPYEGPFNYARMNNLAVRRHAGRAPYVLFCNNDVEARAPGWMARLRSLAARREVGAVGPLLLYGTDRVQHAGVLVGFAGAAEHAMKYVDAYAGAGMRAPGYNCNLTSTRDYSAVTAACMMVRRDAFTRVRGFDERFAIGFNDTDLCLRLGEAGYKVLYDGHTVLYHHESATRMARRELEHPEDDDRLRTRWARFFDGCDPYYSPLLTPSGTDHVLRTDDGCEGRMRVRPVPVTRTLAASEKGRARLSR